MVPKHTANIRFIKFVIFASKRVTAKVQSIAFCRSFSSKQVNLLQIILYNIVPSHQSDLNYSLKQQPSYYATYLDIRKHEKVTNNGKGQHSHRCPQQ